MDIYLDEHFDHTSFDKRLNWHCEPENWGIEDNKLLLSSDSKTDFWQKTHYGFLADNGHFLHTDIEGDFVMETQVEYHFKNQYDQAGLMIRISPDCWIKTSIEYESDEPNKLGAVVTHDGYSDWSTQDVNDDLNTVFFQISRVGADFFVKYREDSSSSWKQLRMTHLSEIKKIQCGIYACSPKDKGFTAAFKYLRIGKLQG